MPGGPADASGACKYDRDVEMWQLLEFWKLGCQAKLAPFASQIREKRYPEILFSIFFLIFFFGVVGWMTVLITSILLSVEEHEFKFVFLYLIYPIFFAGIYVGSRSLITLLARANEIEIVGHEARVSYVLFGRRNLLLETPNIRKRTIRVVRFSADGSFERAWLVGFGGWRIAVLPLGSEIPEEKLS
jgi:hypothetical protein